MRCLIQRVSAACVTIDGDVVAGIGRGLLVFVCAMKGDDEDVAARMAAKTCNLRIFSDQDGRMNLSVADTDGSMLVVSQFTLAADTRRGNRPGFSAASEPADGDRLYRKFVDTCATRCRDVRTGRFGAAMSVALENDGPVTIWLDSD